MGAKKKAQKALRRKFSQPRHPKTSQSLKRAIDEQESNTEARSQESEDRSKRGSGPAF
jgi:hypothetical protein